MFKTEKRKKYIKNTKTSQPNFISVINVIKMSLCLDYRGDGHIEVLK